MTKVAATPQRPDGTNAINQPPLQRNSTQTRFACPKDDASAQLPTQQIENSGVTLRNRVQPKQQVDTR
ncbi:hypothetical protein [Rhizobium laguerreae]|uniref:hypothetical protein n=1 Tax=Rhizobium laguerreae TaxID=1076926 RepID=UPI001C90C2A3|nr:hypothetical protein [Rhizobium laguerreae]MBY3381720.1 hypothetical protein [Rhizobium laguerreae]